MSSLVPLAAQTGLSMARAPGMLKRGMQIYKLGKMAYKTYKRYKRSSEPARNSDRSDGINTFQDSTDRLYSRRRPNRRRVKRAKKWRRSILKVVNSTLADKNFLRQSTAAFTSSSGKQQIFSFSLNGCAGSLNQNDDLSIIINNLTPGAAGETTKYQIKNAVMDLTVTADPENLAITFCDFYYVYSRKDLPYADGNSHVDLWRNQMADLDGAAAVSVEDYGLTPFMCPGFCQFFVIRKVQRIQLLPNQTCSLMDKFNRLRMFNTEDVDGNLTFRKGLSQGIVCVFSGGPSPTGTPVAVGVQLNCTRTYCLNEMKDNLATYNLL